MLCGQLSTAARFHFLPSLQASVHSWDTPPVVVFFVQGVAMIKLIPQYFFVHL